MKDLEEQVIPIISKVTKLDPQVLLSKKDQERLWDSMAQIEIVFALENEFDLVFEQEELVNLQTVEKTLECIAEKQKAR